MPQIEYFFSLMSPFTYLAGDGVEQVARRRGATIRYKPMDVLQVFQETGGQPVPKRHPTRQSYRLEELARLAERSGLPLTLHPAHYPAPVGPASEAVLAAIAAGADVGPLVRGYLQAVWAEERDISDPAVVRAVIGEVGIAPDALAPHWADAPRALARNTAEAVEKGVFGSPTYVLDGERFWGQDRLDLLDWRLSQTAV